MAVKSTHKDFLKAFATRNTERAERLNEQIPDSERSDLNNLVTVFFSVMLEVRFKDDSSHDAVRAFVDEMRYDYREADPPIRPLIIEGLIRAGCGEEHLLNDISPAEALRAQYQVIRKIAYQSQDVIRHLDAYLTDAQLLVEAWGDGDG